MTPSPDLIQQLRASRPVAPADLRSRVRQAAAREAAAAPSPLERLRALLPARRLSLVALPAAAALAIATAGVVGLSRSDAPQTEALVEFDANSKATGAEAGPSRDALAPAQAPPAAGTTLSADTARVQQVSATLTVEVRDSDGVAEAARQAQSLTDRLGGHVVTASVTTGDAAGAVLTLRVPVAKAQEAIVGLTALGAIVSQQVNITDLQESIDAFERRQRSLRSQIAVVLARLDGSLDAETRARLEARLKNLRDELRGTRRNESAIRAEGRMATIQLSVVSEESSGAVAPGSRLDRTLDEAVNVLLWEAVIALAIVIVLAPFALVAVATWLGRRYYRRREDERLLAT